MSVSRAVAAGLALVFVVGAAQAEVGAPAEVPQPDPGKYGVSHLLQFRVLNDALVAQGGDLAARQAQADLLANDFWARVAVSPFPYIYEGLVDRCNAKLMTAFANWGFIGEAAALYAGNPAYSFQVDLIGPDGTGTRIGTFKDFKGMIDHVQKAVPAAIEQGCYISYAPLRAASPTAFG